MKPLSSTSVIYSLIGILALSVGCGSSPGPEEEPRAYDEYAPTITITSPQRGLIEDNSTELMVEGLVTDDVSGVALVYVNGQPAVVKPDGTFRAPIALESGLNVIETKATDAVGKEAADVRAVLVGEFAPADESVGDGLGFRINSQTLSVLETIAADSIANMDIESAIVSQSPLARFDKLVFHGWVRADTASLGGVSSISITPSDGGIIFDIILEDLHVEGIIDRDSSADRRYTLDVKKIHILGEMKISLDGDNLKFNTNSTWVNIREQDVDFNSTLFYDFIFGVFVDASSDFSKGLEKVAREQLPAQIDAFLADFLSTKTVNLLGQSIEMDIVPSQVSFDDTGGLIAADTRIVAGNGASGFYRTHVALPDTVRSSSDSALQLGVADDVLNQLLSTLWGSAGVIHSIPIAADSQLSLGGQVARLDVNPLLPPVAGADGDGPLSLGVGDLMVSAYDSSDTELFHIAVALETMLSVRLAGDNIQLATTGTQVKTQLIRWDETKIDKLTLDLLLAALPSQIDPLVSGALGDVALPSFSGSQVSSPALGPAAGYLLVTGDLTPLP